MLAKLVRLARPRDWAKAVFILLPVPFALRAGEGRLDPLVLALGIAAFCLTSSGVYALNDVRDAPDDRTHPTKRARPVASGEVSARAAIAWGVALLVAGLSLGLATGRAAAVALLLAYLAINAAYTLGAKGIPLLDVFLLASGFLLRVAFGCALVGAPPSSWLLLCTAWIALFLGFGKRRADLTCGAAAARRSQRLGYTGGFLDHAMGIAASLAMLSYALYGHEAGAFVAGRELAGLPFVAFGFLHVLRIAHLDELRDAPVELAWRSRILQLCGAGWVVATAWSLGLF
ncbi:MAG: UbiA prenyltransferase family protein [Deltaproteobacteria bacterium]|nr:UbiA prenyltransferase family protein [Deltaproteobacteria bacterium]